MFTLARPTPGTGRPATPRQRHITLLLTALVTAMSTIFWPTTPAHADPSVCTVKQWLNPAKVQDCIKSLPKANETVSECMGIPTPSAPDSGFGGWFASDPKLRSGTVGMYSSFGYSGYSYPVYNPGCASSSSPIPSDTTSTTTIANGELMVATGIVGAADAFRERAYEPDTMWGWSDRLVKTATKAVYEKVFSIFGAITVGIVGLYLIWRSRQANMNDAMTTAGWAVLVMVIVTAVAAWPLLSAHLADNTLVASLGVIHSAVGPQPKNVPTNECPSAWNTGRPPGVPYNPDACKDRRPAHLRASDTATEAILYNNWLRGTLGSATSLTAKKYGLGLYQSSSLSWDEAKDIKKHPSKRATIYKQKAEDFQRIAQQIKAEDPDAYDYLQGKNGSARIGAGLIAIIAAVAFSFFDIAASLLIILGFLIFRWAVVAIPIIGTIAILRPASAGFKRLINIVVAAIFNIVIFGAGASIYLFAVDIIMNTSTLPGWLQVTLVWLCGVVGWLLLRPYRRITQLGGKSSVAELVTIGSWHRRLFSDIRSATIGAGAAAAVNEIEDRKTTVTSTTVDNTGDGTVPTTASAEEAAQAAQAEPPNAADAGRPGSASVEQTRYEESGSSEDRVWVPASQRYEGGDGYELDDLVRESDARITADANQIDREMSTYQPSSRTHH